MKKTALIILPAFLIAAPFLAATIEEERIETTSGGLLEVNLESGGSVEIAGWGESTVLVQADGEGGKDHRLIVEKTGKGVRIVTDKGTRVRAEAEEGWGRRHGHAYDLKIKVPFVYDLEIETMAGDIDISNVEGDLEGETMGGDLRFSGLKGDLDFETMGGDIELVDSDVDGDVETLGGEVLVKNVIGDVDGSSMGGNVTYENVTRRDGESTGDAVVISTMGGSIEIGSAPGGAKLSTMGGDIGVGDAARFVEAETMGGDIEIGSVEGWVKAETMGGDVEVTVIGDPQATDRDVRLTSMGGDIRLTVPRDFSMEVEIEIAYNEKNGRVPKIVADPALTIETVEGKSSLLRGYGSAKLRGSGSFNGGGNKVEIETVGGDVFLKYGG